MLKCCVSYNSATTVLFRCRIAKVSPTRIGKGLKNSNPNHLPCKDNVAAEKSLLQKLSRDSSTPAVHKMVGWLGLMAQDADLAILCQTNSSQISSKSSCKINVNV
ncbi:hypothetical protein AVEN_35800-1 [Araneus ventricosus]|uniref:Uncharacterized protein n=1 Tax=Araneus ventricosus TaxID=182803 RepID=A0A4Y2BIZ3_ARAVE|nr:hypothetical protein AVEN_35800-1 [Araneus ventricosus]